MNQMYKIMIKEKIKVHVHVPHIQVSSYGPSSPPHFSNISNCIQVTVFLHIVVRLYECFLCLIYSYKLLWAIIPISNLEDRIIN